MTTDSYASLFQTSSLVSLCTLLSQAARYSVVYPVSSPPPPNTIPKPSLGRKEILDGMLGANLICFQVHSPSPSNMTITHSISSDLFLYPAFHLHVRPRVRLRVYLHNRAPWHLQSHGYRRRRSCIGRYALPCWRRR